MRRYSRISSGSPYSTGAPVATRMRVDGAGLGRLDLVERLHRLDQQQRLPGGDRSARRDEGRRAGLGRQVGDADHRAEHRAGMVGERPRRRRRGGGRRRRRRRRPAQRGGRRRGMRRPARRRAATRMRPSLPSISISVRPVSARMVGQRADRRRGRTGFAARHASRPRVSVRPCARQRQRVAADAEAADHADGGLGDVGVVAECLAPVDVGDSAPRSPAARRPAARPSARSRCAV